jgi:hypothetical protein
MQKTFRLLLAASAILLGALWFAHWTQIRALNSGEVHLRPQPQNTPLQTTPTQPAAPPTDAANQPNQQQELASNGADTATLPGTQQQNGITALPTAEPLTRNPTSGIVVAGSGKFQLYRQGDLTFRLNTETGHACVLFATDAQWRKPLVYDHGCANH